MSESVEVIARVIDAINRGDFDAVLESASDDLEFDFTNSDGPMSAVYRGRDGARDFWTSFREPFASVVLESDEIIELEDGRLLSGTTVRVRGQGSGVDVSATGAWVWTVRNGKVAAVKMFQSKAEALEATG